jgi:hypothetical protein
MLKLSQPQKIMIILLIAFLFVLPYTNILFQSASIVLASSSNVNLGNDGLVYTITTILLDKPIDATYTMIGESKTLNDGTQVKPTVSRMLNIKAENPTCKYILKPEIVKIPGTDTIIYEKYILSPSFERSQKIIVSDISGNKVIGDAFKKSTNILKNVYNDGKIEISFGGSTTGALECPSGDFIVLKDKNDNPKVFNRVNYNDWVFIRLGICTNPIILAQYVVYNQGLCADAINSVKYGDGIETVDFGSKEFSKLELLPKNSQTKTEMVGTGNIDSFGMPIITLTADERYFNSVRISPSSQEVEPTIVSISNNNPVENKQTSYLLIVNNPSIIDKKFYVEINAKYGSVSPSVSSIETKSNSDGTLTFFYTAPSVNEDISEIFTIKACDIGLNNIKTKCTTKTFTRTIRDDDTIIPVPSEYCGDNICQTWNGENKLTCSKDCGNEPTPTPTSCKEIDNSIYSSDAKDCVCSVGFDTKYNPNTGKMYCEKPQDIYGLVLVILGALILGVVVYTTLIKKGRGR